MLFVYRFINLSNYKLDLLLSNKQQRITLFCLLLTNKKNIQ